MPDFNHSIGDRDALLSALETLITEHRANAKSFAMLLIKIKNFRRLNVSHGIRVADSILAAFVGCLTEIVREQDILARVGNADFALLLPQVMNEGHAKLAAIKIIERLEDPLAVGDKLLQLHAEIGIALFPQHAEDGASLFNKTECALIEARSNPEAHAIYSDEDNSITAFDWDIESDLQKAIEKDQFELYYQPQVNLHDGCLFGAEALIRWQNGSKGFIRPDLFIPVAERSGQISEITSWTLNAALWSRKAWPSRMDSVNLAVNISAIMLSDPGLIEMVRSAINIYAADFSQLTLEITESALVEDMSSSLNTLQELKSLGLNISIDDFGTGYSSLAYFKNIPANELKIDRSFICCMLENPMDQHIVKTIIQMARGFELTVVAEGIEDQPTWDMLRRLDCNIAQGYLLARPMPAEDFMRWSESRLIDLAAGEVGSIRQG